MLCSARRFLQGWFGRRIIIVTAKSNFSRLHLGLSEPLQLKHQITLLCVSNGDGTLLLMVIVTGIRTKRSNRYKLPRWNPKTPHIPQLICSNSWLVACIDLLLPRLLFEHRTCTSRTNVECFPWNIKIPQLSIPLSPPHTIVSFSVRSNSFSGFMSWWTMLRLFEWTSHLLIVRTSVGISVDSFIVPCMHWEILYITIS